MQNSDQKTSNDSSTAVDTGFRPERYWTSGAHPRNVEIASVNWSGNRTYYLDAHPDKAGIAYKWRVGGDHDEGPSDLAPTEQPLALDELMSLLEENCVAESSLEEAWDMAWYAVKGDVDFSDPDALDYGFGNVSDAYGFASSFYPGLSNLYDERFQAWRDQQQTADE